MPRGASPKREREYEKLVGEFEQEGRYKGREEQVAARIVNKQRSEFGETRRAKQKDAQGRSPDRNLPIKDYEHLTEEQPEGRLARLRPQSLRKIRAFEQAHRKRKVILELIDERLSGEGGASKGGVQRVAMKRRASGSSRRKAPARRATRSGQRRAKAPAAGRTARAKGGKRAAASRKGVQRRAKSSRSRR